MKLFGFNPYLIGGVALVIAGLATFAGCEHHNANAARADRKAMESERDTARVDRDRTVKANGTLLSTITSQDKALNAWAELGESPAEVRALIAKIAASRAELEQRSAANEKRRRLDDANPDCEKLRRVDFQRACPNRAGVLRGHEDRYRNGDGGS